MRRATYTQRTAFLFNFKFSEICLYSQFPVHFINIMQEKYELTENFLDVFQVTICRPSPPLLRNGDNDIRDAQM